MVTRSSIFIPPMFRCVGDVVSGLKMLEQCLLEARDRRGIFVTAYLVITRILEDWIDRRRFLENEQVARYVIAFANAYRTALALDEEVDLLAIPRAWQQSFDACRDPHVSILQALLLGINAHINHDLPYAVLQSGLDVHCDRCQHDHTLINDALRTATPLVRRRIARLYRPVLHIPNWLFGRMIDEAVTRCFQKARHHSWRLAQALEAAVSTPERARVEKVLNDRAALAGQIMAKSKKAPTQCLAILYEVEFLIPCPSVNVEAVSGRPLDFGLTAMRESKVSAGASTMLQKMVP